MEVEDVRPDGLQKSAERPYAEEGGEAFFADWHQDMAGTFLFQLFYHASSAGNDNVFHTLGGESPAELQNDLFHASGFHGGDEMHYFHKVVSWGKSLERMWSAARSASRRGVPGAVRRKPCFFHSR